MGYLTSWKQDQQLQAQADAAEAERVRKEEARYQREKRGGFPTGPCGTLPSLRGDKHSLSERSGGEQDHYDPADGLCLDIVSPSTDTERHQRR